ncbi:MAG: hypothetical protein ACI9WC_002261 [Arenicella sp.]|jgi:hypothetical protein
MILRRLTLAFRKQDWFTVAVEILIVVLGVFIALQVNNWNTARSDRAEALIILELLEQDVAQVLDRTDRAIRVHTVSLAATARVIHGIRGENFDEETLLQDILDATNISTPPGTLATFTQLVSSSRLKLIHSQDLRRSLTEYDALIRFIHSQYGVFTGPRTQALHTLTQASTLQASGLAKNYNDIGQLDAVDRQMLNNNPQMMTALQTAYGVHENIHAVLSRTRNQVVAIQGQIRAEQENIQ